VPFSTFIYRCYVCMRACVRVCVCVYVYMYVQGMDKIFEILDNMGIIFFLLVALKEHQLYLSLFFCLFTMRSTSASALQIVFSNSLYESTAKLETCQIFKEVKLLVCFLLQHM
jgi:hypothetical protein